MLQEHSLFDIFLLERCIEVYRFFEPVALGRSHIHAEGKVNKSSHPLRRATVIAVALGVFLIVGRTATLSHANPSQTAATTTPDLLGGFRHVEVASVSDALEQITGKRMYMSHRMRPLFTSKFAGYALTVHLRKQENHDPHALDGMIQAIDQGGPNSVWVMVVDDGADIAGMGGLMGTAMSARNYAGAVIDGGVRDVGYLQKIGFPVFAMGIVPSTSVGHYVFDGSNRPVICDDVLVHPGDIVVADSDGVAVVPRDQAQQVLTLAQDMDFKEHSMYSVIEKLKSLGEAIKQFGRL
jgi:regulator of RNase E activity RraA